MSEDELKISAPPCHWSFDAVSGQFDEHIEQSVPNYRAGHQLVCRYADFCLRDDSLVYELGCSTGVLARTFLEWNRSREDLRYVALDTAPSMVEIARRRGKGDERADYLCEDATTFELEPCTAVIAYYTVQFIHPAFRQDVFNKVYRALEWGGMLLVFEKVRAPDARFQDYANQIYMDIKQCNGFTEEEIVSKSQSLRGVLEPFSTEGNLGLMTRAGFRDIVSIYKWVCFEGWVAVK